MAKTPSTPNRERKRKPLAIGNPTPTLITPSSQDDSRGVLKSDRHSKARRQLSMVQSQERDDCEDDIDLKKNGITVKKTYFGRNVSNDNGADVVQPNTRQVYALVNKMTGSIGGNGE